MSLAKEILESFAEDINESTDLKNNLIASSDAKMVEHNLFLAALKAPMKAKDKVMGLLNEYKKELITYNKKFKPSKKLDSKISRAIDFYVDDKNVDVSDIIK